jgi:methyl-accepting chemotaxis protein
MSTAPAGLTKNLRLQGKFLLFFGLVSLVFVTIFHFVSYLGSRNIVENVVYDRIENDLRAIKVLLNTSLNASVSNILVYEAEVLQAGLNETENLQEYFWTMEATQKRLKARGIDLIALEDLGQRTFPFTPRFSSLWLERDYEGNFYIQEVITRSEGVNDTRIQTLSHREIVNGQHRIHIHTFFYVPALDKVILLSALRSDFVHSLALEDIREAVVGFQFGERGSIELFTKENIQLIHSARQFESTIRDTDLHDKVIRMRSGITREEIPLSDLNSKVYVSSSAADSLQSETIPIYYSFDWIPDVDWFIVHGAAESEILRPVNNLMVVSLSVAVLFFLTLFILTFLSTDTIFIKRLTQLGVAVRRFQERDFEARAEVSENDELTELSQSFNSMAAEIQVYAKDLESLVQHRTEELVQAVKMAALGGLVAGVAHEINTPLGIGVTTSSHILERVEAALQAFQAQQFTKEDFLNFMKEMEKIANILQTSMNQASKLIGSFKASP